MAWFTPGLRALTAAAWQCLVLLPVHTSCRLSFICTSRAADALHGGPACGWLDPDVGSPLLAACQPLLYCFNLAVLLQPACTASTCLYCSNLLVLLVLAQPCLHRLNPACPVPTLLSTSRPCLPCPPPAGMPPTLPAPSQPSLHHPRPACSPHMPSSHRPNSALPVSILHVPNPACNSSDLPAPSRPCLLCLNPACTISLHIPHCTSPTPACTISALPAPSHPSLHQLNPCLHSPAHCRYQGLMFGLDGQVVQGMLQVADVQRAEMAKKAALPQ